MMTEYELSLLTDEEREAIEDVSDEDIAQIDATADEDVTDTVTAEDTEGDSEPDDTDADAPVAEKDAAEESAEPAKPEKPARNTVYDASLPDDYQDKLDDLKAAQDTLSAEFRNGDLDFDEFQSKLAELQEQRDQLALVRVKHEISQEMKQQSAEQQWADTVHAFMESVATQEGFNYQDGSEASQARMQDLDIIVQRLASMEANRDKPGVWFLEKAHSMVKAMYGVETKPAKQQPDKRKPNTGDLPSNLANVPGGDGPGDISSPFSDIDKLDGDDLEAALARMTPAQREKYAMLA